MRINAEFSAHKLTFFKMYYY